VKTCSKCKQDLPLSAFTWTRSHGKRIKRAWCRACVAAYDQERKQRMGEDWYRNNSESSKRWRATPGGVETLRKKNLRYRRKHPEKARARDILQKAVSSGLVVVTGVCECGSTQNVERHHEDYSKPLEFRELCAGTCHPIADELRRQREAAKAAATEKV